MYTTAARKPPRVFRKHQNEVRELSKKIGLLVGDPEILCQERHGAERVNNMQKNRIYGVSESTYTQDIVLENDSKHPQDPAEVKGGDMSEAEDYMRRREKRCKWVAI